VASTGRCNVYTLALEKEMLKMKQRRRIYYNSEQRNLMWGCCTSFDQQDEQLP
jgi:hypothetical protein